jgi:hypothetical protein
VRSRWGILVGSLFAIECQLFLELDGAERERNDAAPDAQSSDADSGAPPVDAADGGPSDSMVVGRYCDSAAFDLCFDFDDPDASLDTYSARLRGTGERLLDESLRSSEPRSLRLIADGGGPILSNYLLSTVSGQNITRFRVEFAMAARAMPPQDSLGDIIMRVELGPAHQVRLLSFADRIYLQEQEIFDGGEKQRGAISNAGAPLTGKSLRRMRLDFILDGAQPAVAIDVDGARDALLLSPDLIAPLATLRLSFGIVGVGVVDASVIDVSIDDVAVTLSRDQ